MRCEVNYWEIHFWRCNKPPLLNRFMQLCKKKNHWKKIILGGKKQISRSDGLMCPWQGVRSRQLTDKRPSSVLCFIDPLQCTVQMSSIATEQRNQGRPRLGDVKPPPHHRTTNQSQLQPCQTEPSSSSSQCGWEARRRTRTILTLQRWDTKKV